MQRRDFLKIDHPHGRIGRRLDVHNFCVWTDRALMLVDVIRVDECGFDTKFWQPL